MAYFRDLCDDNAHRNQACNIGDEFVAAEGIDLPTGDTRDFLIPRVEVASWLAACRRVSAALAGTYEQPWVLVYTYRLNPSKTAAG